MSHGPGRNVTWCPDPSTSTDPLPTDPPLPSLVLSHSSGPIELGVHSRPRKRDLPPDCPSTPHFSGRPGTPSRPLPRLATDPETLKGRSATRGHREEPRHPTVKSPVTLDTGPRSDLSWTIHLPPPTSDVVDAQFSGSFHRVSVGRDPRSVSLEVRHGSTERSRSPGGRTVGRRGHGSCGPFDSYGARGRS